MLWKSELLTHALHIVPIYVCRFACILVTITTISAPICVVWMRFANFSVLELYAFEFCQLDAKIETPR
jgi:hypothetical protein